MLPAPFQLLVLTAQTRTLKENKTKNKSKKTAEEPQESGCS
jgi:hypothetical protein